MYLCSSVNLFYFAKVYCNPSCLVLWDGEFIVINLSLGSQAHSRRVYKFSLPIHEIVKFLNYILLLPNERFSSDRE